MPNRRWETVNRHRLVSLAEKLRVQTSRLRPCFAIAWKAEVADPRHKRRKYETLSFLALEMKVLGVAHSAAREHLQRWAARNGGWPTEKLEATAKWPYRDKVDRRHGCPSQDGKGKSPTRHWCVGSDTCRWFQDKGWRKDESLSGGHYTTRPSLLRDRGWYRVFPSGSVEDKVYTLLCSFEERYGFEAGYPLYFSQKAARCQAKAVYGRAMRDETVSEALERLRDVGLIEILTEGARGRGRPRIVRRVIAGGRIPYAPQSPATC